MAGDDVLIIDDDPQITGLLEEALSLWNIPAKTESNTTHAACEIIYRGKRLRVIISDFDNRYASGDRQGGLTLYQQLQQAGILPEHYIMISGYCRNQLPLLPEGVEFIQKPLNLRYLKQRIEEIEQKEQ